MYVGNSRHWDQIKNEKEWDQMGQDSWKDRILMP